MVKGDAAALLSALSKAGSVYGINMPMKKTVPR